MEGMNHLKKPSHIIFIHINFQIAKISLKISNFVESNIDHFMFISELCVCVAM